MHDLQTIAPSCAVLLGRDAHRRFDHLGTAWCVGPREWVTAWAGEEPPAGALSLMSVADGAVAEVTGWEQDDGLAGFTAAIDVRPLPTATTELHKRARLWALGWPSTIDHPAFRLSRGSLDPQLYFPYLCPWTITGHCALFSAHDGWLTGRCYPGMAGGPVLDTDGAVVGVLLGSEPSPDHPPLARFQRLG